MNIRRLSAIAGVAAIVLAAAPAPAQAPAGTGEYEGAAGLGLALRRLGNTKRVLMIGAHPDDEDTPLLSALAIGQGDDVAYLSLTRGEGGQNGVGPELGPALGLLRTEELLAARRVDGAQQLFSRAYDFGFSKNADEAFRHWPREQVLEDVVGVIRLFRPDVVVAVFSGTPADGHGQHQVSAILAREAFDAAADPARFPDQVAAGLRPYRTPRYYQSLRSRAADDATVRLPTGELDPLLGRSYFQLAMASRSRHRSQDMGGPEPAGPRWGYLKRLVPAAAGQEATMFAGTDSTLSMQAARIGAAGVTRTLRDYDAEVARLRSGLNPLAPDLLVPGLSRALALLARADDAARALGTAGAEADAVRDLRFRIAAEMDDARAALAHAARLELDATADRAHVVPGQAVNVEVTLWNGGAQAVQVAALAPSLPAGWAAEPVDSLPSAPLAPGALLTRRFRVRVPASAQPTEAYFLRRPQTGDLYAWPADWTVDARPFEPAAIRAAATVRIANADLPLDRDATFREVDPRQGELRRPVLVVPAVSVTVDPAASVLPLPAPGAAPAPLRYRLHLAAEEAGVAGTLRLRVPQGWTTEPASLPVRFDAAGERQEAEIAVRAPAGISAGDYPVTAVFETADGRRFERGLQLIDYPHVNTRPLYHAAASTVRAFDVKVPQGLRVAYVTGAGEAGPGVLAGLGIVPDLLDARALEGGDLSQYDVIVTGSRAYEVRPDLRAHNDRLLQYVRNGGTLIVQYYKFDQAGGTFTPFPMTFTRTADRVTDEASPVRLLAPDHPALSTPNRITPRDFEGWIQDRGLWFPHTFDPAYTPLLETQDPGEPPLQGGLLVAKLGRGTYVYTGLAFFRQLPEGVPGAYRLFANLLALGAKK
jgi:LmbE family N-acetylglucosaminyl deacetylase